MPDGNTLYFNEITSPFAAPTLNFLAFGDLNGEGIADFIGHTLVAAGQAAPLRIALGKAGGGFTTDVPLFNGAAPSFVSPKVLIGDFTGDGRADMAVYDAGTYDWAARTTRGGEPVLFVAGADGKFTASTALSDALKPFVQPLGANYRGGYQIDLTMGVKDVAAADIDGDGDLDLWLESTGSANIASHFMINNGGVFTVDIDHRLPAKVLFGAGYGTSGDYFRYGIGRFIDANGDNRPDLLLGQIRDNDPTHLGQTSYVVLNDGTGNYPAANKVALPLPNFYNGYTAVQAVAAMDINRDGRNDLLLVHTRNDDVSGAGVEPAWTGTHVQVLIQTAGGQFSDETAQRMGDQSLWSNSGLPAFQHATDVHAFDVNRDGIQDFILSYGAGLRPADSRPVIFLGQSSGGFVAADHALLTGGNAFFGEGIRPVDLNRDQLIDFVHVDSGPGANSSYNGMGSDDVSILVSQLATVALGGSAGPVATPTYAGQRGDYTVAVTAAGVTVTARSGGAPESFGNAERITFADKSINLTVGNVARGVTTAQVDSVIELYIAYINRVPDADGMVYWINQLKAGQSLSQIGEAFYGAALQFSSLTGYTPAMSNGDFVTLVYRNVLGRSSPDAEGLAYWSNALASGEAGRGTLVSSILSSAHTFKGNAQFGYVADLLDNKVAVGKAFAVTNGLVYNSSEASISNGMAIAAAVTATDTQAAIALIGVTDGLVL